MQVESYLFSFPLLPIEAATELALGTEPSRMVAREAAGRNG